MMTQKGYRPSKFEVEPNVARLAEPVMGVGGTGEQCETHVIVPTAVMRPLALVTDRADAPQTTRCN